MGTVRIIAGLLALLIVSSLSGHATLSADQIRSAKASISTCTTDGTAGVPVGTAILVERPSSEEGKVVDVLLSAEGLAPGKHAVHIHEIGACSPCSAAGSHLDLGPFGHNVPVTTNHPYHSGDLVNLRVDAEGKGAMATSSNRIALTPDSPDRVAANRPLSILDENGSSIIIHALPDVYCPDPADANCAGGARTACGIIRPTR